MFKNWLSPKEKIGLLPYKSEPIYGLTPQSAQIMGWEITKFNIPQAWKNSQGENVVVAVLDTGCDLDHYDLKENILEGKNFIETNSSPIDKAGHGTHVASTIAACNNGYGMVGVAPKTKIIPVKVLNDDGNGSISSIVDGIYWASDINEVNFITMSLGSAKPNTSMQRAIEYANNKKKVIFCAAGNSGPNTDIMYPAKYVSTIAIGAIDKNLHRTSFSCSGDSLDFLAPGDEIIGCFPGNKYAVMSGTSMSNPFAVGCASLLLSYNKKSNKFKLNSYQNYIDIFKRYSLSLSDPNYESIKKYQGYGILYPVY